jgi:adenylylsulfate kinase
MRGVVWITGLPASGKTTLAYRLCAELEGRGRRALMLDSDEVRKALTPNPRFTPEERLLVYRAMAYTARKLAALGAVVVVAATAHERALRDAVRSVAEDVFLVWARCPVSVCEARDPKGLYRQAHTTHIGAMPGVHASFEEPTDAQEIVDTSAPLGVEQVRALAERIEARFASSSDSSPSSSDSFP